MIVTRCSIGCGARNLVASSQNRITMRCLQHPLDRSGRFGADVERAVEEHDREGGDTPQAVQEVESRSAAETVVGWYWE
jgi:hypothetical protein